MYKAKLCSAKIWVLLVAGWGQSVGLGHKIEAPARARGRKSSISALILDEFPTEVGSWVKGSAGDGEQGTGASNRSRRDAQEVQAEGSIL